MGLFQKPVVHTKLDYQNYTVSMITSNISFELNEGILFIAKRF